MISDRNSRKVYSILNYIILGIASLVLLIITTANFFNDVYLVSGARDEYVMYTPKAASEFIGFVVIAIVLILLKKPLEKIKEQYVFLVCIIIYFGFGAYMVACSNVALKIDAALMWLSASRMLEGDYSTFAAGGYVSTHTNQVGLLFFEYLLAHISSDVRVWYGVYLLISTFSNFVYWRIIRLLFNKPMISKYAVLLMTMFLPNFFFILFMYGNLLGFCMLLCAFYFFLKYLKKHDFLNMIFMAVFVGLSCYFKNNYLVGMIAFAVLLFIDIFKSRKAKNVLAIALVFLSFFALQKGSEWYSIKYYMADYSQKYPRISYIFVGLNDEIEGMPGWANGHPYQVLLENDRNIEVMKEIVSGEVKDRIAYLADNPGYAFDFFKRKIIFTWCDQDFQSISSGPDVAVCPMLSKTLNSIYYVEDGFFILYKFNGMINLLLYLGTIGFIIVKLFVKKEPIDGAILYPLLWLVGGFLFHLIWETKSQYVLYYVFLLVPYAGYMLDFLAEFVGQKMDKFRQNRLGTKTEEAN